jgi:glycosyltransferase involved in cell wall biosynthesis
LVIDHFGAGGAQRQMVNLACGLKERGHDVQMFVYFPEYDFFRSVIDQTGIRVHPVRKGRGFSIKVVLRLMRLVRTERIEGVISFLNSPNVYAELARIGSPRTTLIVSERSSHHADTRRVAAMVKRLLHVLASRVVTNSRAHAAWLRRFPWLRDKVTTIYNGYAIANRPEVDRQPIPALSLLVIGRIGPEKNGINLVRALVHFHRKHGYVPNLSWVGNPDTRPAGVEYRRRLDELLDQHPEVSSRWAWLGERSDIPRLLEHHYALIHPSLYEGLPNVICEALMSGRPVLASEVCDHPNLVGDGRRGFLFDPEDPEAIAHAIERLAALSADQWLEMSFNARRYADEHLGIETMVSEYEALLAGRRD